jgi:hypothetical protein
MPDNCNVCVNRRALRQHRTAKLHHFTDAMSNELRFFGITFREHRVIHKTNQQESLAIEIDGGDAHHLAARIGEDSLGKYWLFKKTNIATQTRLSLLSLL